MPAYLCCSIRCHNKTGHKRLLLSVSSESAPIPRARSEGGAVILSGDKTITHLTGFGLSRQHIRLTISSTCQHPGDVTNSWREGCAAIVNLSCYVNDWEYHCYIINQYWLLK